MKINLLKERSAAYTMAEMRRLIMLKGIRVLSNTGEQVAIAPNGEVDVEVGFVICVGKHRRIDVTDDLIKNCQ